MSAEPVAPSEIVPATADGTVADSVGALLSTLIVTTGEYVGPLPAASVTAMRTSAGPSGTVVESQWNAKPLVSVPTVVKLPAPLALTWKSIAPMPETDASALPLKITFVPLQRAAQPPTVTVAEPGAVLSTIVSASGVRVVLPASSVSIIWRWWVPSLVPAVCHVTCQPSLPSLSAPIDVHGSETRTRSWNSTEAIVSAGESVRT